MQRPTTGTKITVTTESRMRSIWGDYRHSDITGTVIASPKWLKPNEFAVSNPAHPNGFSVIHLSNVVDIRDADGRELKFTTDSSVRVWSVAGSTGNKYTVTREDGEYRCTCTGFQYRKHCKHITECTSD
tara:strand:- start:1224 stop:1610 length:387 start_codon:yes stop_codon:yes gene_type:complete